MLAIFSSGHSKKSYRKSNQLQTYVAASVAVLQCAAAASSADGEECSPAPAVLVASMQRCSERWLHLFEWHGPRLIFFCFLSLCPLCVVLNERGAVYLIAPAVS
eukprot:GHVP01064682.1.p1 GENE.GHVP01064682.1~~GHVP01064682.1.p1  ORF type:complete len:104 (+),score=5.69 GHVP01064682.1:327-638(+)